MCAESAASELKALTGSLTRVAQALERQETLLGGLALWVRLLAMDEAKSFFEKTLDSDKKRWVYEAHDGEATQTMIEGKTLVPQRTVSRWAQEWEALGVLIDVGGGKRRKIIPLAAIGVDVPPWPSSES